MTTTLVWSNVPISGILPLETKSISNTLLNTPAPGIIEPVDLTSNIYVKIGFSLIYLIIFVVAVVGNSLVLFIVSRNSSMQTPTNLFIANLAVSDLMLSFLSVPFTPISSFLGSWVFGKIMCHIVPMVQGCGVYISTLTLSAIALDRYEVMFKPFAPKKTKTRCFYIILGIWTMSLTVVAPYAVFMEHTRDPDNPKAWYCNENWPPRFDKFYSYAFLVLQYFLPLCVIAYCYIRVSAKITERVESKSRGLLTNLKREREELKRKDRTNRMLISMVAVFAFCWLPLNLIHVIKDVYTKILNWPYFIVIFFTCHTIAMSSICYNPLIYAWMNDNFRKEFKAVLPCFRNHRANGSSATLPITNEKRKVTKLTKSKTVIDRNTKLPGGQQDNQRQKYHITFYDTIHKKKLSIPILTKKAESIRSSSTKYTAIRTEKLIKDKLSEHKAANACQTVSDQTTFIKFDGINSDVSNRTAINHKQLTTADSINDKNTRNILTFTSSPQTSDFQRIPLLNNHALVPSNDNNSSFTFIPEQYQKSKLQSPTKEITNEVETNFFESPTELGNLTQSQSLDEQYILPGTANRLHHNQVHYTGYEIVL